MNQIDEISRLKRTFSDELLNAKDQEEREQIQKRKSKQLFKAMKNLDKINESAPEKMLERRRTSLKLNQQRQISFEELKDDDIYEESESDQISPTVLPVPSEPSSPGTDIITNLMEPNKTMQST